ncbi:hypothetical protein NESM_000036000 [Novymonas esmeraldas]|uniref:Uncharacterized protein n=1 Tax=Novymonas esmeraldas TaxID=1808958 RepID=A0AAW0F2L4_9TRYP
MSSAAVAALPPRGKLPAITKGGAAKSRLPPAAASAASEEDGALIAAVATSNSSRRPSEVPHAATVPTHGSRKSKADSSRERQASHSVSPATRTASKGRARAASGSARRRRLPSSTLRSGSRVYAATASAAAPLSPQASRSVRRISEEIALNRVQRAVRWFLMRRSLQRTVPVASHPLCTAAEDDADVVLVYESRFLHRLRAEVYRAERVDELRTGAAKRAVETALSRWAQARQLQHQRLSLQSSVLAVYQFDPVRAAELDAALSIVQASLRLRESSLVFEERRARLRELTAVRVLERAWRDTPHYTAATRNIHDRHVREVLCRHESVERRDLIRRHLVFMVRCHQVFFNDPRMWDAGVAVRRIPLYTRAGLLSDDEPPISAAAAAKAVAPPRSPLSSDVRGGMAHDSSAAVAREALGAGSLLRSPTAPFTATTNPNNSISCTGLFAQPGFTLLETARASWCPGAEEADSGRFSVDAALRLCEYRLLFSPSEWHLLGEAVAVPGLQVALSHVSGDADGRGAAQEPAVGRPSDGGAIAPAGLHGELQVAPAEPCSTDVAAPSYAELFASALTFLRQPRVLDASGRRTVQHLHDIRHSAIEMQRELRTHGVVTAPRVAPFLRFGIHYQALARGYADLSSFTTTPGMHTCRPLVAGRVACAATELRQCLIGAVQGSGGSADLTLPVVLEEHWCNFTTTAAAATGTAWPKDGGPSAHVAPRAAPTAMLLREGFTNPTTEALFRAPAAATRRSSAAHARRVSSRATSRRGSVAGPTLVAEWGRRLATSADEIGPYWREFLLGTRVDALAAPSAGEEEEEEGGCGRLSSHETGADSPAPSSASRRLRVGLQSCLAPSAASAYLLQDFMPGAALVHWRGGSGTRAQPPRAATATVGDRAGALVIGSRGADAAALPVLSASRSAVVPPVQWWDAVERLLLQEYTSRTEVTANEAAQRGSVTVLRRMSCPAVYEPATDA